MHVHDSIVLQMPSSRITACSCGGRMRLQKVTLHETARDVEVLAFACPDCERRLHVIQPLGTKM